MTDNQRPLSSFNAWYERHAESFNEERKQKYASDPELRERARVAAKDYRQRRSARTDIPDTNKAGLSTSSRVAAILGITRQTLMNWEGRGLVPRPQGKHRLYTEKQVDLLEDLHQSLNTPDLESAKSELWQQWEIE